MNIAATIAKRPFAAGDRVTVVAGYERRCGQTGQIVVVGTDGGHPVYDVQFSDGKVRQYVKPELGHVYTASPESALPTEVDTELSRLSRIERGLQFAMFNAEDVIRLAEDIREPHHRELVAQRVAEARERLPRLRALREKVWDAQHPLEAEFTRRGGWPRYFLVDRGHLHDDISSTRCSREWSTLEKHYWMTEYSGRPADEVIADAGTRVCTRCFPDAPVADRPTAGRFMTLAEAEQAAYAEADARQRAAKKAAELRTAEDAPLVVTRDCGVEAHLRSDRAAWRWVMEEATSFAYFGDGSNSGRVREDIERVFEVLAPLRGTTVEELRAEVNRKVAAKARREGFEVMAKV